MGCSVKRLFTMSKNLYYAALLSGACSLVIELTGARLIAPYLGNTIYTWSAVIGLVLASLSVGYYIGGRWGDRYRDVRHLQTIFFLAALATAAIPVLAKAILPYTIPMDLVAGSLVAGLVLVPASVLYGTVSPYIVKLTAQQNKEGETAGNVFAFSTLGSLLGVFGTGFVLIPALQLTQIFILTGALMMLAVVLFLKEMDSRKLLGFLAMVLLAGSVNSVYIRYGGNVLFTDNSEYYNIAVVDKVELQGLQARILLLDNELSTGITSDYRLAFFPYKAMEAFYSSMQDPEDILVLGTGGGSQVTSLQQRFPDARIDAVEIDPQVVEVGKAYFGLTENERTILIIDDARRYLRRNPGKKYDLIVVDVFRSTSIPGHLATREFVQELKVHLNREGRVVVNTVGTLENKPSPFALIYNAYQEQFQNVYVVPMVSNPQVMQNIIIVASDTTVADLPPSSRAISYAQIPTDEWNPIDVLSR